MKYALSCESAGLEADHYGHFDRRLSVGGPSAHSPPPRTRFNINQLRPEMIRSVRAIVRSPIPEHPVLRPGIVVAVSCLAFESPQSKLHFPATPESRPELLFWLSPDHLLPYSKFLRRQPASHFWMLAHKERLCSRHPDQFLTDPMSETFSPKGFRFESIGELIYYLRLHQFNANKFSVCQVGDIHIM